MPAPIRPVIIFNSSTGTDTAASGAGPTTAVTGTGASLNGTTSVDLSADSPDLSGVATDGSAALWVATSSGRQFSRITAVDNGTKIVTVATTYSVTESGRTWAIGGKRATFDNANSRAVFADLLDNWTVETETDQSITSKIDITATSTTFTFIGMPFIRGSSGSRKVISTNANDSVFDISTTATGAMGFKRLALENTNVTKTAAYGIRIQGNLTTRQIFVGDCRIGHATNSLLIGVAGVAGLDRWDELLLRNCDILSCTSHGISTVATNVSHVRLYKCFIHNCGGWGVLASTGVNGFSSFSSIISNNTSGGVSTRFGALRNIVDASIFANNGGSGLSVLASTLGGVIISNSIFANNGAYGIGGSWANPQRLVANDYNAWYNNTSGNVEDSEVGTGTNAQVGVDPQFTNASSNDFSLGTNLKALGGPSNIGGAGLTTTYEEPGAAQRQEAASGGASNYASW